jgi:hypothetical protein
MPEGLVTFHLVCNGFFVCVLDLFAEVLLEELVEADLVLIAA